MIKIERFNNFVLHTLKNEYIEIKTLNLGATLYEVYTYDKDHNFENIVLSNQNLLDYLNPDCGYFSNTVGRNSGRIGNSEFNLNGVCYKLKNDNKSYNLHGGIKGFSFQYFDYETFEIDGEIGIIYKRKSPHMEENFPGNLDVQITFTLKRNTVLISYSAKTDKNTIVNLTNHAYFNLSGDAKNTILNHRLMVKADMFLLTNEENVPTGILENVEGYGLDFRKEIKIKENLFHPFVQAEKTNGIDHCLLLNENKMSLYDDLSGRYLEVETSYPAVQLYTTNFPGPQILSNGNHVKKFQGICLECQYEPDAINNPNFSNVILKPEETYNHYTKLTFSVKK